MRDTVDLNRSVSDGHGSWGSMFCSFPVKYKSISSFNRIKYKYVNCAVLIVFVVVVLKPTAIHDSYTLHKNTLI